MKDKERFISIDDSGESIFTFDEADMIIDTKTNIVYGANNIPDLVKILNSQSSQWQKLKEIIKKLYVKAEPGGIEHCVTNYIYKKMRELEAEDVKS